MSDEPAHPEGGDETWRRMTSPGLVSIDADPDRRAYFASRKPMADPFDNNPRAVQEMELTSFRTEGSPRPKPTVG